MIKELKLKNWKSFKEATLYIDPLTILIGANASGKSNALDALLFLQRIFSGVNVREAINGNSILPALRGGIEWVCLKPNEQFTLEILTDSKNKDQEYSYELTIQITNTKAHVVKEEFILLTFENNTTDKKILFTDERRAISINYATVESSKEITNIISDGRKIISLSAINYPSKTSLLREEVFDAIKYVTSQLQQIFVFDPIPSHMRNYTPLSDKLQTDGSNIAGVLAGLPSEQKDKVEATITQYLKALPEMDIKRVWTETVGRSNQDAMLYCEESWNNGGVQEIDARSMSDGTLRFLAIITALLTREKGSLLVIEEVDNGLHPSRAHVLIDMLKTLGKERGIDVIVTTHNPALLDAAGVRMLPFITVAHRDDKTGASQLIQLEDIQQLPKMMASGSIGKLNSEGRIESALKQDDAK